MKFEDWKQAWPALPVTGILATAYVVVWMDRVGCSEGPLLACWLSAAAHRGADLIWLGWVKEYQTLAAAMIAAIAALGVIAAAQIQKNQSEKIEVSRRSRENLRTLNHMAMVWRRLWAQIVEEEYEAAIATLADVEKVNSEIGAENPYLAQWSQMIQVTCGISLRTFIRHKRLADVKRAQAYAAIGLYYFDFPAAHLGRRGEIIHRTKTKASLVDVMSDADADFDAPWVKAALEGFYE